MRGRSCAMRGRHRPQCSAAVLRLGGETGGGVVLAFVTYESFRKPFVLCREMMAERAGCVAVETSRGLLRAVQTQG